MVKMLCEQKTSTQSSLADEAARLGASLDPKKRQQLQGAMVASAGILKRLRENKRLRDWKLKNPERMRQHANNWHHRNRDLVLERNKSPDRKRRKADYSKQYQKRPDRKKRHRLAALKYVRKNKDKRNAWLKTPEGRAYSKKYQLRRLRTPEGHFMNWLRGTINRSLREQNQKKLHRTIAYVGCTAAKLRKHLESQFTEGMNWNVPRGWDADHIVPISKFDLSDPEESMLANNYKNFCPLWKLDNQIKSDTLPNPLPDFIPPHIAARILHRSIISTHG